MPKKSGENPIHVLWVNREIKTVKLEIWGVEATFGIKEKKVVVFQKDSKFKDLPPWLKKEMYARAGAILKS